MGEHGDTPERRLRRAACALDTGRPEVAEAVIALAFEHGDGTPDLVLTAGRVRTVRGDGKEALDCVQRAWDGRTPAPRPAAIRSCSTRAT